MCLSPAAARFRVGSSAAPYFAESVANDSLFMRASIGSGFMI
jgi:hypothetical protein